MNRPKRILAALLLVAAFLPAAAHATVVSGGLKIRWVGEAPSPATAGKVTAGRFEIVAGAAGVIENVRVDGLGWTVEPLKAPQRMIVSRGERRNVEFRAVPQNEREPLTVSATLNGRTVRKSFHFDAASLTKAQRRRVAFEEGYPRAAPAAKGARVSGGQIIRFKGRIAYDHPNGTVMGADHIPVRVMDDDSPDPFDETIWSGETDENGNFDVVVEWDDGLDDPDIYIQFTTAGPDVDVQTDDFTETSYEWPSSYVVLEDYTGNFVDWGTLKPPPSEYGAIHVYNNVLRARRMAALYGMSPEQVDVQWPDDNDGTFYDPDDEEIHVETEQTWSEGTLAHEFAHYLNDKFGNLLGSDYHNGFCDQDGDGHCVWCPENLSDAWQEGFANWFGSYYQRTMPARYGIPPSYPNDLRYTLEDPDKCQQDSLSYADGITEGFVGALLRDMEDDPNDDHDGGALDCDMDVMSLGPAPLMEIFRDYDPTDIYMFRDAFRLISQQHDQDLWSTCRNVWTGFGFPTPTPVVTSAPEQACEIVRAGESVYLQVQGNGALLKYQWRREGGNLADGGGVSGATTKALLLSPTDTGMSGTYNCLVSTCDGSLSALSLPFEVTILPAATPKGLVSWGSNESGQVGDGTQVWRRAPTVHENLANVVKAVGGASFSAALRADGTVLTWGTATNNGELGNGLYSDQRNDPGPVPSLTDVIQIAAGNVHGLALKRDGRIWGWGYNGFGNLADSTSDSRPTPVLAKLVTGCVRQIACGAQFSMALMADGTVQAWGDNASGTLGRGTAGGWSIVPQAVSGLSGVEAISACGNLALALKTDGSVWAWGSNQEGALGIGVEGFVQNHSAVPVQVINLPVIRKITAGSNCAFAISNTGAAYGWGSNGQARLADPTPGVTHRTTPALIQGLTLPVQIVAGWGGFAAALQSDGTVWMWGYNNRWPLGRDWTTEFVAPPQQVLGVNGVAALGNGWSTLHACGALAGVTDVGGPALPDRLALLAAPNPSFGRTRLAFDLPRESSVTLAVYDIAGRRVRTLFEGRRAAGRFDEVWDGRGDHGTASLVGVYFARLDADGESLSQRIVRIR